MIPSKQPAIVCPFTNSADFNCADPAEVACLPCFTPQRDGDPVVTVSTMGKGRRWMASRGVVSSSAGCSQKRCYTGLVVQLS